MERTADLKLISIGISACSKFVKWQKSLALLQAGAEFLGGVLNQKRGKNHAAISEVSIDDDIRLIPSPITKCTKPPLL